MIVNNLKEYVKRQLDQTIRESTIEGLNRIVAILDEEVMQPIRTLSRD